jgi:hypothetical protein
MKFALLKQLSELDPMLDLIEAGRLVVWMPPKARRLMSAA